VQHLGATRSVSTSTHLLQTPDTFVRIRLPGMERAMAVVHTSPAIGARFTEYTAELESGGHLGPVSAQRFVYVLNGTVTVTISGTEKTLDADGFAYLPQGSDHSIAATSDSRIEIFEKRFITLENEPPPAAIFGNEKDVPSQPLMGDPDLQVRSLLPDSIAYDFAVNTMEYKPGAALAMVEMHVMEHGLLMLSIWMAPYCPQWFGALGKQPAKYLIYKDFNRNPLD
jgi:(S)-ureidoglycine aminohydrolase